MQRLTDLALKVLRFEPLGKEELISTLGLESWKRIQRSPDGERNYRILGEIMNGQQSLLRDLYEVSIAKIEDICSEALAAGAYGAKISGAGMGGSVIALVKNEEEGKKVVKVCLSIGSKDGWVSKVGEGVRVERP
ncbi:hypothetical protein CP083_03120 [Candidatus Bathyarchaeota archaeon B24-2]|nr:MAG: hypothetical protein CP083_03120 [Candidatus Bathyarchaeota archaeon B24-2]